MTDARSLILIEKATRALKAARLLLDTGDTDGACNRAYYAMFDAAHAALFALGVESLDTPVKTHNGLIALFGMHLVRGGHLAVNMPKRSTPFSAIGRSRITPATSSAWKMRHGPSNRQLPSSPPSRRNSRSSEIPVMPRGAGAKAPCAWRACSPDERRSRPAISAPPILRLAGYERCAASPISSRTKPTFRRLSSPSIRG